MSEEFFDKSEQVKNSSSDSGRETTASNDNHYEGYGRNYNRNGGYEGRTPRPRVGNYEGRTPRPRFNAGGNSYENHTPRPRFNNGEEGGYQPRPRYNSGGYEGGYQPRPRYNNYNNGGEGGYQPRPRYNNNEDGYQPRQAGGYQPRPRYSGGEGYQPRPRYNTGEGGYQQPRPRYNSGGGYGHNRNNYGNNRPNNRYGSSFGNRYNPKRRVDYKEELLDPNAPIRLNKFLANAGVCSRRDADKYIEAGVVTVNGNVVTELGTKILRTDEVRFHDEPVSIEKKVYILLNKPKGYVTTSEDPQNRKTVMDLVKNACPERIYPVGRLDRNTTGVLLLTNDGELASKLTHPKFLKKKIYHVYLDKNVSVPDMQKIAEGITLEDGDIKADEIQYASPTDKKQVGIEIHSGKNRIVRRIFESLGYHVTKLDRVYFAGLTKKALRRGDWRYLTEQEVNVLRMGAFE